MSHNHTFVTLEGCIINWSSSIGLMLPIVPPASSITCMATTGLLLCQLWYLFLKLLYLLCLICFNLGGHLLCWNVRLLLTCTVGIAHFLFLVLPALPLLRLISNSCSLVFQAWVQIPLLTPKYCNAYCKMADSHGIFKHLNNS